MSHLSHSEIATMTGNVPSAVTPTTHVDVEKRVLVTQPHSLELYAKLKGYEKVGDRFHKMEGQWSCYYPIAYIAQIFLKETHH